MPRAGKSGHSTAVNTCAMESVWEVLFLIAIVACLALGVLWDVVKIILWALLLVFLAMINPLFSP